MVIFSAAAAVVTRLGKAAGGGTGKCGRQGHRQVRQASARAGAHAKQDSLACLRVGSGQDKRTQAQTYR